jgi:hypothetical protein
MRNLLLLFVGSGFIALMVLLIALGMARNSAAILGPAHLILFAIGAAFYLWPSLLALHRKCKAAAWIISINILLGWTILGWIASMVWAARGMVRALPIPSSHPGQVVAGH